MTTKTKYPDNNPKTAHGAAKTPLDLVPTALMRAAAEAFKNGASKYGPYNWRDAKISSSVYYAAALRHLHAWWEGEDIAPDSGVHHLGHAAACLALVLDTMGTEYLNDNRPKRIHFNDARGEGEDSHPRGTQTASGVLAHARAKRDGKPRA
jgi:hypothetical protein